MGLFGGLFSTQKEKKTNEILSKKPKLLMHTSTVEPNRIQSIRPSFDKMKNINYVFATDSEKIAYLYTMQPFFSFTFGQDEKGIIVVGDNHSLLKLDNKEAYVYFVDSDSFNPIISDNGKFEHEWTSNVEVNIRKDIQAQKVVFNDVLKSGIQVFWINNMNTLLEIDKQMQLEGITNGNQKLEFLINQTNWKPDKVMYMNAFRKICPAIQTDKGWAVDYNVQMDAGKHR